MTNADEGQTIKVRASFTDYDGFSESMTSAGLSIPEPQDNDLPETCKYPHNFGDSPESRFSTTGCLTQDMIDYLHSQGNQADHGVLEFTWEPESRNHWNGSATNGQRHSH